MDNCRNRYTYEDLKIDIDYLCDRNNYPLTKKEAKSFILNLLNKESDF